MIQEPTGAQLIRYTITSLHRSQAQHEESKLKALKMLMTPEIMIRDNQRVDVN